MSEADLKRAEDYYLSTQNKERKPVATIKRNDGTFVIVVDKDSLHDESRVRSYMQLVLQGSVIGLSALGAEDLFDARKTDFNLQNVLADQLLLNNGKLRYTTAVKLLRKYFILHKDEYSSVELSLQELAAVYMRILLSENFQIERQGRKTPVVTFKERKSKAE